MAQWSLNQTMKPESTIGTVFSGCFYDKNVTKKFTAVSSSCFILFIREMDKRRIPVPANTLREVNFKQSCEGELERSESYHKSGEDQRWKY